MSRETVLAATFVELADTWEDDFQILGYLQNLVDRSVEVMGAAVACLTLADSRGRLRLVASTNYALSVLQLIELANDEGPGWDAFVTGEPVVNVPRTEAVARWPRFVRATNGRGFQTVQVVPLRLRAQVLGTLCLLFHDRVRLSDDDQVIASAMVKIVTMGLLQERTPRQKELLAERFQSLVQERIVVEQAQGIIAERAGIDVDAAFRVLESYSEAQGLLLGSVATGVVEGSLTTESLRI